MGFLEAGAGDRMRHVTFVAPSAYTLGGLATWLDYLLPGLRELGWRASLMLVEGPRHHRAQEYLEAHPCEDVISVLCNCGTPYGRSKALEDAVVKSQPDICVTVNIPDMCVAVNRVRTRSVPSPRLVMSCHGIQGDLFADMKQYAALFDGVICTNRLACHLAERISGIASDRLFHARYGVELPDLHENDLDGRGFRIAFAGRLEQQQKRILDLVTIAKQLRVERLNYRFLIAGSGPDEGELRDRVQGAGLQDCFEFLGHVPPSQIVSAIYDRADAFLLTSSWETGPLVIWEAMARGVPVVSSRYIGSGAEGLLKQEENCLLFDIGDCEAAAVSISRAVNQPALSRKLVSSARTLVQSELTHAESAQQWNAHLSQILQTDPVSTVPLAVTKEVADGRLDRVLGNKIAWHIRKLAGTLQPDSGPGGEWPHAHRKLELSADEFWKLAAELDRPPMHVGA